MRKIKVDGHDDEVGSCQVELDVLRRDNHKPKSYPLPHSQQQVSHENHQMRSLQETQ